VRPMSESSTVCVARKAVTYIPCGRPVFKWLAQVPLCSRHYDRAIERARLVLCREQDADDRFFYGPREWEASAAAIVYYVQRSDSLIKIGTSATFRSRLSALRAEHGTLQVLLTHRGDRKTEQAIHRKFRNLRAEGEFFRPGKPLLTWIVKVRQRQPEATLLPGTLPMAELEALAGMS
jgi:Meiotically Up-regulated Gene 113 (MUG113) protein